MTLPSSLPLRRPPAKAWGWLMLALIIALAAGAALVIRNSTPGAPKDGKPEGKSRSTPVLVATATTRDVNVYLEALGTVASRNSVTVKTRIDGQLMQLYFREGQSVKAGTLLAEVDPRPFEVQLAQVSAQLAKDKATLHNAESDLERYQTLLAQDSIARQQYDTQAALVLQDRAAIAVDQAQVDSARLQLSYCRIPAPISGVVGLRQVDPGNQIHASDANGIVTITQLQPITVLFPIPEDNLPAVIVRTKAAGAIPVDAYDRQKAVKLAQGRLLTLDNQIDPATGTIKLRAEFGNEQGTLFPNQFVNTKLLVAVLKDAVVVPASAIQLGSHGSQVYVLKADSHVELRAVTTGIVDGESIVIVQGLAAGESVVTDGADKLRDGAKVKAVEPATADKPRGKSGEGKHRQRSDA